MNRNDRRVAIAAVCVGVLALVGIWLGGGNPPTSTQGDEVDCLEVLERIEILVIPIMRWKAVL